MLVITRQFRSLPSARNPLMNTELRILYTGTEKEEVYAIEETLKKQGLNFVWKQCTGKSDFIHALHEFLPHVVLCEDKPEVIAPIEAIRLTKKSGSGISFLLITETLAEDQIAVLAKEGLDDFVYKDRIQLLPQAIKTVRIRQSLKDINTSHHGITFIEASDQPIREDDKTSIPVNSRNIPETSSAEHLLQKSEANLRTIFDNTNVSYVLSDRKFKVISFNPSALTIYKKEFKVDLKEGDSLLDYLPEERKILSKERFERALSGEKVNYEMSFTQPKGNKNWYNVNMFAVRDKNNTLLGFIISSEDITARKNTELERTKMLADIVQHNKDLEQFSYIISHNLRSPVANIIGLSNIIKNADQMNKPDFDRCIDGLVLSASKLDEIIVDLNFILQKRREINEKKEMVSFSSLLNDIKTIISELIDRENILIHSNFTVNKIFTVRSYLHSIFLNLITNSIKYRNTATTTAIDISAHKIDNRIILTFKDNGMGIDLKNYGDKLFGLYKKFHTHVEGKGMGLYMVKTQVEILGGKISVQSQVGKGTEFTITFEL